MKISETLRSHHLLQDCSNEEGLNALPVGTTFYVGFDPTAPYLQLGNLVPLMAVIRLAQLGMKPLILFGGATGAIGDPSGKDKERQLLERNTIDSNVENQTIKAREILSRVSVEAEFINNFDWTKDVILLDFLRDVGKYLTVNYMLSKEVVKKRIKGSGMSFAEFSYQTLQAYDFLHLYQTKNCHLQIGGSDQWGNITSGLELIRKKIQADVHAFSIPLITNSEGKKFGKSEGGAVWLDGRGTSPYKLHQFILNIDDMDVIKFLKIFTFKTEEEILELEKSLTECPEQRLCQKTLADSVVQLIHGEQAVQDATKSAQVLFGGSLGGLTKEQLLDIFSDVPSSEVSKSEITSLTCLDIFEKTALVSSRGEGKKLIKNGGAYLDNQKITDPNELIKDLDRIASDFLILRSGKKNYHLVKVAS